VTIFSWSFRQGEKMARSTATKPEGREPERISAARFKAECLALMDRVQQDRSPLVITKRGKPVAKLVPYDEEGAEPQTGWGWLRGTVTVLGDIVGPTGEEWSVDAD
jgi:prevent-host-death family protein